MMLDVRSALEKMGREWAEPQGWYGMSSKKEHGNRDERPDVNLYTYSQLVFDKGGKNIK